jgi:hypothetical protein
VAIGAALILISFPPSHLETPEIIIMLLLLLLLQ